MQSRSCCCAWCQTDTRRDSNSYLSVPCFFKKKRGDVIKEDLIFWPLGRSSNIVRPCLEQFDLPLKETLVSLVLEDDLSSLKALPELQQQRELCDFALALGRGL
jgi:hypothetical protein